MSHRNAVALPAVLFAMTLVSALVVGGVYATRTLVTSARLARTADALHAPAERLIVELVAGWDTAGRAAMPIGAVVFESPGRIDGVPVTASVLRLNEYTYWMIAAARDSSFHGIGSRLSLLVRAANGEIRPVPGPAWTRIP